MDRAEIEEGVLRHVARHRGHPCFVSPRRGGGVVSYDENDIQVLGVDGFAWSAHFRTLEGLEVVLDDYRHWDALMFDDGIIPIPTTKHPLFHGQDEVKAGIFLYYRAETQCLFAVHVRSIQTQQQLSVN